MIRLSLNDLAKACGEPVIERVEGETQVFKVNNKLFHSFDKARAEKLLLTKEYRKKLFHLRGRFDKEGGMHKELLFLLQHYPIDDLMEIDMRIASPLTDDIGKYETPTALFKAVCPDAFDNIKTIFPEHRTFKSASPGILMKNADINYVKYDEWMSAIAYQRFLESLCATVLRHQETSGNGDITTAFPLEVLVNFVDVNSIAEELEELSAYVVDTFNPESVNSFYGFEKDDDIFGYKNEFQDYVVYRKRGDPAVLDPFKRI